MEEDDRGRRIIIECECELGCIFDIIISSSGGRNSLETNIRLNSPAVSFQMLSRAGLANETALAISKEYSIGIVETFLAGAIAEFHTNPRKFQCVGHLLNSITKGIRNGSFGLKEVMPDVENPDLVSRMKASRPEFIFDPLSSNEIITILN
jgi:hypothetical protein